MTRHLVIFIVCFLVGAVITTIIRTSRHQPYVESAGSQQTTPSPPMSATPSSTAPVNTRCAICGMPVNPALLTAVYHGKVIGFGCKACPARFAKEPDTYGPSALANQVVEEK